MQSTEVGVTAGRLVGGRQTTHMPLKVLLVEDSSVLVERLRELFEQVTDVELVATVDTEQAAIDAISAGEMDAIVLDLQLKRGSGFGVLRHIATMSQQPVRIVLTNYDLPEYRRQATALGARYFLDKARDYDRLLDTLREIAHEA